MDWLENQQEMIRGTRVAVIGTMAFVLGAVSLIVPDADPKWMFSPYAFAVGMPFLIWGSLAFPEHRSLRIFTYSYWTGRPYPLFVRLLLLICGGFLLFSSFYALSTHYRDEAARKSLREHGTLTTGTIIQHFSKRAGRSSKYFISFRFALPSGGSIDSTVKIPSKRYWPLKEGQQIRVAYPANDPSHAIPADIEIEKVLPIEIAWMFFLIFVIPPAWYLLKARLIPLKDQNE